MKLSEIRETCGKSGEYYGIDDILGEEIMITEDVNVSSEIREYKTKKDNLYYCLKIRSIEEKDLHLTRAALLAISDVMPQDPKESWRGYRMRINRIGTGFKTAYKVIVVGKALMNFANAPAQIVDSAGKILAYLKQAPAGVEDKIFWEAAMKLVGNLGETMQTVEKLKNEGRVVVLSGTWRAT